MILSSCLLRMLHKWCEALIEALTISKTGLWLLELIAQEPHIIGAEAVSACGDVRLAFSVVVTFFLDYK